MDATTDTFQQSALRFCSACGKTLNLGSKFCGECGAQLGAGLTAEANTTALLGDSDNPSMSLLKGWGFFFLGVISCNLSFLINITVGCIAYLAIGVFMSRFVMARLLQWHPNYNTLYNVVSAKLWMVILWPIRMLMLLLQLTANKVF